MKIDFKKIDWWVVTPLIIIILVIGFVCYYTIHSPSDPTPTQENQISTNESPIPIVATLTEEQIEEQIKKSIEKNYPNIGAENTIGTKGYSPIVFLNDLKWWTGKINEDNKYAFVDMEYPQFIGGDEVKKLNEYIREIILGTLSADRSDVEEEIASKAKWCEDYPGDAHGERVWSCSVQLVSTYKIFSIVNNIVSLEIVITDFTGGGSGNHNLSYVINWDIENNLPLDNKDIFCAGKYPDELAGLIYKGILNNYKDELLIDEDTFYTIRSRVEERIQQSDVLLGYHDLTIVFQPYAILSGVFGIVKAPIPYSELKGKICIGK